VECPFFITFKLFITLKNLLYSILFFCATFESLFAQKVGVVLSGGGAGGLAHIGVLKALEEEKIPVHYICGTSIGGLIASIYASGFSPVEMDSLIGSAFFQNLTKGEIATRYQYYFKKREASPSWINFKLSLDTSILYNLPTNIINSIPVDYGLMKFFAPIKVKCKDNFDSLFIPFRCLASDIESKQSIVFRNGDLATAVRSSMSYPFFLKPIKVDDKLLFDGGLYNNFPSNVMYDDFYPDIIIGSSVTDNSPKPDEDNIYSQLRNMFMSKSNFNPVCQNGIVIKPWSDVSIFDFESAKRLIDSGYAATKRMMPEIKSFIYYYEDSTLQIRRKNFRGKLKQPIIHGIDVQGLRMNQAKYVKGIINQHMDSLSLTQLDNRFYRLASDDRIKSIYPQLLSDSTTSKYKLRLSMKREKDFEIDLGGMITNKNSSTGYASVQYNYFGRFAMNVMGDAYFGRLNNAFGGKLKFDFASKVPFFVEPSLTYSRWDYYRGSSLFFNLLKPAFLIQRDRYGELNMGLPVGNLAKVTFGGGSGDQSNLYYQNKDFSNTDTADRTDLIVSYAQVGFDLNTLNRKQYASKGSMFSAKLKYFNGQETYFPGSTSIDSVRLNDIEEWFLAKVKVEQYYRPFKRFQIGMAGELTFSTQQRATNFTATQLISPVYSPVAEMQTGYFQNYRSYQYLGIGPKIIVSPFKNFEWRTELYVFQPFKNFKEDALQDAQAIKFLTVRRTIGTTSLVYHTPLGPIAASFNYYSDLEPKPFTFFLHIGFTIFKKRILE
jgi:NTE family protein